MTNMTPEYIAMCDCPEIQVQHKPERGQFYVCACKSCRAKLNQAIHMIEQFDMDSINKRDLADVEPHYAHCVRMADAGSFPAFLQERTPEHLSYIFLPDQRWYQEQIRKAFGNCSTYGIIGPFNVWYDIEDFTWFDNINNGSFEILWCAFYMQEIHGKRWSGNGWV